MDKEKDVSKHESTPNREANGRWIKGAPSPNPAGRGMTNRQKISERLLSDLADVWEKHGRQVLEMLAVTEPAKLATIAYGLLPKDVFVRVEDQRVPGGLQPEAFAALRSLLDVIQRVGVDGEPERVFEMIEEDLRARLAVPVDNV